MSIGITNCCFNNSFIFRTGRDGSNDFKAKINTKASNSTSIADHSLHISNWFFIEKVCSFSISNSNGQRSKPIEITHYIFDPNKEESEGSNGGGHNFIEASIGGEFYYIQ